MFRATKIILVAVLLVSIIVKAAGAMLVHDQADVSLAPWWCSPLQGKIENSTCKVKADYSRDFYSGRVLLRQKRLDGTYVTWKVEHEQDVKGVAVRDSHYEFFKDWSY